MKLFFAIPYFKNASYLKETLQSLIEQSNPDWHAVVFDDSIDPDEKRAAIQVIQELNNSKIELSHNPLNFGLAKNWNQGLDYAQKHSSKFQAVSILHGDDKLLPNYVDAMLTAMKQFPDATAFFCETRIIDETGNPRFSFADYYKKTLLPKNSSFLLKGVDGIKLLIPGNFVFCPTLCFVVSKLGFERFQENLKQVPDFELILRLLLKGDTLVGIYGKALYEYRRHTQNTTQLQTQNLLRFIEERDLYLSLSQKLVAKNHPELAFQAKKMRVVKLNLLFNAAQALVRLQVKNATRFIQFMLQLP